MKLKKLVTPPQQSLRNAGWDWMLGEDTLPYITDDVVVVSEQEAEQYYEAADELYEMFIEAGQHVLNNNRLEELGIPENLHRLVKYSWDNDKQWHLYGRVDLIGGLVCKPNKII